MDDSIKYEDFLNEVAENVLCSLDSSDLPFDLNGRKLRSVSVIYIFDDYSTEVTQVEY